MCMYTSVWKRTNSFARPCLIVNNSVCLLATTIQVYHRKYRLLPEETFMKPFEDAKMDEVQRLTAASYWRESTLVHQIPHRASRFIGLCGMFQAVPFHPHGSRQSGSTSNSTTQSTSLASLWPANLHCWSRRQSHRSSPLPTL